jgi:hypothetical protein
MKPSVSALKQLRIYKEKSILALTNQLLTGKLCQIDFFVDNVNKVINKLYWLKMQRIVDPVVDISLGSVFIGGHSLKQTKALANTFNQKNVGVCFDFGCEGGSNETPDYVWHHIFAILIFNWSQRHF